MIFIWLVLFIPHLCYADIFSKPAESTILDQSLSKDVYNFYYRGPYDYNAYAPAVNPGRFRKNDIAWGINRYDFQTSLNQFMLNRDVYRDFQQSISGASANPLLTLQYSSPTVADLYKHMQTLGYLRLAMRYQQYQDLENSVNDPLVKLRKQAMLDCMRNSTFMSERSDIEASFRKCFDNLDAQGVKPYEYLRDPQDAGERIEHSIDVTEKVFERVNVDAQDLSLMLSIVPHVFVDPDSVHVQLAQVSSRELIAQERSQFLTQLKDVVETYQRNHSVSLQELAGLSVFGVPLTEGQIRNLTLLNPAQAEIAMHQMSSNLAYLKTVDQYLKATEMLGRVMSHPAIQPGYKTLLQGSLEYVQGEIGILKEEKDRLSQYADTMRHIMETADEKRSKLRQTIKQESEAQNQKALFQLNP